MSQALSASAQFVAVAAASAAFTNPMEPGKLYRFTSSTNCWVRITTTGTAAVARAASNHYCGAMQQLILVNPDVSSTTNAFVKVIRDTADGDATLSPLMGMGGI